MLQLFHKTGYPYTDFRHQRRPKCISFRWPLRIDLGTAQFHHQVEFQMICENQDLQDRTRLRTTGRKERIEPGFSGLRCAATGGWWPPEKAARGGGYERDAWASHLLVALVLYALERQHWHHDIVRSIGLKIDF
jgi:hypothetical protein